MRHRTEGRHCYGLIGNNLIIQVVSAHVKAIVSFYVDSTLKTCHHVSRRR